MSQTPPVSLLNQFNVKQLQIDTNSVSKKIDPIPLSPLSLLANLKPVEDKNLLSASASSTTILSSSSSPSLIPQSLNKIDGRRSRKMIFRFLCLRDSTFLSIKDTDMKEEVEHETQLKEFNPYEDFQISNKLFQFNLLKQLLKLYNLSFDWFDIILDLAWKCCDLVKPDIKHDNDNMDIRNYLKIKKLPG